MVNLFQQSVALVGQASNKVAYYRRLNVVDNITGDLKRAKELLSENEEVFNEAITHLFGEKFKELMIRLAKSKKKSKDALSNLASDRSPSAKSKKPFSKGSLSSFQGGSDRGHSSHTFSRVAKNQSFNRGKSFSFSKFRAVTCYSVSQHPLSSQRNVSKGNSSNSLGRTDKVLPEELGEINKGPGLVRNGARVQNPLSEDSYSRFESNLQHLSNAQRDAKISPGRKKE